MVGSVIGFHVFILLFPWLFFFGLCFFMFLKFVGFFFLFLFFVLLFLSSLFIYNILLSLSQERERAALVLACLQAGPRPPSSFSQSKNKSRALTSTRWTAVPLGTGKNVTTRSPTRAATTRPGGRRDYRRCEDLL